MSHHSDENPFKNGENGENKDFSKEFSNPFFKPFAEIAKLAKDTPKHGATGNFPDGKITDDDKGEIQLKIATRANNVIIDFGEKPIYWMGMNKQQALALGRALFENADKLTDE